MPSVLDGHWGKVLPPVGSCVNWGHQLAQGLAGAWLFGGAAFDLTGYSTTLGSPSNAGFNPRGAYASSTAGYLPLRSTKLVGGGVNLTLMSFGVVTGTNASGRAAYCERGSSGNDILKIGQGPVSGGPNITEFTYRNDGGTLSQVRGTRTINDGLYHQIVGRKIGTALTTWVDGVKDGSLTFGSGSDAFTDASVEARACGDKGDNTAGWVGTVSHIFVWRRALTDEEIRWLNIDPYAFIIPPAPYRRSFVMEVAGPPPGSGGTAQMFAVF